MHAICAIYTDGSALNNGFEGARAGVGVFFGEGDPRNVSAPAEGEQTNQNAELQALHWGVVGAIEVLRGVQEGSHTVVEIHTDSAYSINCVTTWYTNWLRNGWKTAAGHPVKHRHWIESTAQLLRKYPHQIRLVKVKGHSGEFGNEMADQLAGAGAGKGAGAVVAGAVVAGAGATPVPKKWVMMGRKRVVVVTPADVEGSDE